MSIDVLQEKIRKGKSPVIADLSVLPEHIPAQLWEGTDEVGAYVRFSEALLEGARDYVSGVRFSFDHMALMGKGGLEALSRLLRRAGELGYYVILEAPQILTLRAAERSAERIFGADSVYPCDGLILSPYIGSDGIRPFLQYPEKDLFIALRTPNKSGTEVQELLTGSRHVYTAIADTIARFGSRGKWGYTQICALVSARSPNVVAELRKKYKDMFLLVDGYDDPGATMTNCALAFDRMGHGGAVCAGICDAWYAEETDGSDFIAQAVSAAQRIKRNLARYVTIL